MGDQGNNHLVMGPTELPAGVTLQGEAVLLQNTQHPLGIHLGRSSFCRRRFNSMVMRR